MPDAAVQTYSPRKDAFAHARLNEDCVRRVFQLGQETISKHDTLALQKERVSQSQVCKAIWQAQPWPLSYVVVSARQLERLVALLSAEPERALRVRRLTILRHSGPPVDPTTFAKLLRLCDRVRDLHVEMMAIVKDFYGHWLGSAEVLAALRECAALEAVALDGRNAGGDVNEVIE